MEEALKKRDFILQHAILLLAISYLADIYLNKTVLGHDFAVLS